MQSHNPLQNGDNLLHRSIRHLKHNEVRKIQELLLKTNYPLWVKSVNADNKLPIELIPENSNLTEDERDELYSLLLPATLDDSLKKITEPVDFNEVLQQCGNPSSDSELYTLLKNVCLAVNYVRTQLFSESESHPDFNSYSETQSRNVSKKLKEMRVELLHYVDEYMFAIFNSKETIFNVEDMSNLTSNIHITFPDKLWHNFLDSAFALFKKTKTGNCFEYNCAMQYYLEHKLQSNYKGQLYEMVLGDHNAYVIKVGSQKLLCDAWSGQIEFLNNLQHQLKGTKYIYILPENPKFIYRTLARFNSSYDEFRRFRYDNMLSQSNLKTKLNHVKSGPFSNFIYHLARNFSVQDKALFYILIQDQLEVALERKLLLEHEVYVLKQPKMVLKAIFGQYSAKAAFHSGLFTLQEVDNLAKEFIDKLLSLDGLGYLLEKNLKLSSIDDNNQEEICKEIDTYAMNYNLQKLSIFAQPVPSSPVDISNQVSPTP